MPEDEFLQRTKLTGIQKTYYVRACRIRRLSKLPYSRAWQYRDEIRKLEKAHEQYLFLVKNNIHSLAELVAVKENFEEKQRECRRERRGLSLEKRRFEPLFELCDRMRELQAAEDSFAAGDVFFLPEHKEYQDCTDRLGQQGYTMEEVETVRRRCQAKLSGNYEKKKAVNWNLRLAGEMAAEVSEAARKIQDAKKQIESGQENKEKQEQPKR